MANLLESLAGGLRSAAGVLNPRVQEQTFAADERTRGRAEQLALEERRMQMQMQQQLMMQQQQHSFQQSTPQAQMQMEALKNEKAFREAAAQAQGDPEKLATAAMQFGKPEIAMNLYKSQEDRVARAQQAKDQIDAKLTQFEMMMQDKNLSREQQAAIARQADETKRQGQAIQGQIAQMFDATRRMAIVMRQGSGGGESAPVAVMGPDGKPVYVARKDAIGKSPASASIAGSGTFTPETLKFVAKQYLSGDRQAVQGFARSATARIALQNAIVDEAAQQGLTPEMTAAKIAEFAGTVAGSRTIGQRAANISLAATEAVEMLDIVKESSDKFGRTNFVPFNMAIKAFETNTGSPEIAEFGASLNALVNVYARAINPTGVPTVSDKEHARDVINSVQSPAQVNAVLGIIRRELEIAKKAPGQVTKATTSRITGVEAGSFNADKERRYQEWKAKQK